MTKVFVGNLDPRVNERDLEDEFRTYGVIRSVWVARRPPGYAFVEFDDRRDALDSIEALDGKNGWRVELSHNSKGSGGGRDYDGRPPRGGGELKCYECGEPGHFARQCRVRSGYNGSYRRRSPSPRYRRSPSYGRSSYSPRGRSITPPRRSRRYSRSPSPYRRGSPYRGSSPYSRRSPYGRGSPYVSRSPYRRGSADVRSSPYRRSSSYRRSSPTVRSSPYKRTSPSDDIHRSPYKRSPPADDVRRSPYANGARSRSRSRS